MAMAKTPKPKRMPDAAVEVRLGRGVSVEARITSAGLLAVGALVSGILLSTAVIVSAASGRGKRFTVRSASLPPLLRDPPRLPPAD